MSAFVYSLGNLYSDPAEQPPFFPLPSLLCSEAEVKMGEPSNGPQEPVPHLPAQMGTAGFEFHHLRNTFSGHHGGVADRRDLVGDNICAKHFV